MAPTGQIRDKDKLARMEQAVRVLIQGLGEDLSREGLRDTPKRVAKALLDCTQGYHQDTSSTLGTALFHEHIVHHGDEGVVVVRDIDFASTSEETLLPFHGRCHVAYRPKDGVVLGLSKLARLTKQYAKRLQTQERLGAEIALALQQSLECHGVAVVLQARQLSNLAAPEQRTTACVSGVFAGERSAHLEELLSLLDLEDLPCSCIAPLDALLPSLLLAASRHSTSLAHYSSSSSSSSGNVNPHSVVTHAHLHADPGVPAPGTPDPSEKDTDGDSDDLVMDGEGPEGAHAGGAAAHGACSGAGSAHGTEDAVGALEQQRGQGQQQQVLLPAAGAEAGSSCSCDAMEAAMQRLLLEIGEDPHRRGLHGSARRYVESLLTSTSGYQQQLPDGVTEPVFVEEEGGTAAAAGAGAMVTPAGGCPCCSAARGGRSGPGRPCSALLGQQAGAEAERRRSSWGCAGSGMGRGCGSCAERGGQVVERRTEGGLVTVRLPFASQCEHHMLPFYGTLMVAYRPGREGTQELQGQQQQGEVGEEEAGLVDVREVQAVVSAFTQRLQVQERITHQVADAVGQLVGRRRGRPGAAGAGAGDVMVVCDAAHMCMVARGVENHSGSTTTFAVRGAFAEQAGLRRQVLRLFRQGA